MNGELDRLRKLYGELGDEHLSDLSKDKGDLTDDAQLALAEEMRRRGMTPSAAVTPPGETNQAADTERSYGFGVGIPGIVPGGEPAMEHALEPGGEIRMGMAALTSFSDGIELSRACEVLEAADIDPAIEEISGDETTGTITRFEIWVSAADLELSRSLLREKMGLFPIAETDGGVAEEDGAGDGLVGQFASGAEAEEVRSTLEQNGMHAMVEHLEDDWLVRVSPREQDRAVSLLADRMGVN